MGDGASYFFIRLEVNLFVNICTQTRRRLCRSHESEELVFYAHVINAHSYSGIFTPHSLAIHCGVVRYYVATGKLHCIVTKECQYSSTMKVVLTWCHSINSQTTLREPLVLALLDYDFQMKSMIKLTADSTVKPCTAGCELLESLAHSFCCCCCCCFKFCSKFIKTHIGTV